jgi:hypothetical protein
MPRYRVSISRTRHYDGLIEVEAGNLEQAGALAINAGEDYANTWCDTWDDPKIDYIEEIKDDGTANRNT